MSRTAHLGIGILLGLVFCFWCMMGMALVVASAFAKDGSGEEFFNAHFIAWCVFWTAIASGILWGIFRSLKSALRPPPRQPLGVASESVQIERAAQSATPDERLAHLLKNP